MFNMHLSLQPTQSLQLYLMYEVCTVQLYVRMAWHLIFGTDFRIIAHGQNAYLNSMPLQWMASTLFVPRVLNNAWAGLVIAVRCRTL